MCTYRLLFWKQLSKKRKNNNTDRVKLPYRWSRERDNNKK